jgi:hypothetical protein
MDASKLLPRIGALSPPRVEDEPMDTEKRSVEGAVEVYLDRLARCLADGDRLADAKDRAITIAVTWLDGRGDRATWQPRIEVALAALLARGETRFPDAAASH